MAGTGTEVGAVGHGSAVAGVGRVLGLDDDSKAGKELGSGRAPRDPHCAFAKRLFAGGTASEWAL